MRVDLPKRVPLFIGRRDFQCFMVREWGSNNREDMYIRG